MQKTNTLDNLFCGIVKLFEDDDNSHIRSWSDMNRYFVTGDENDFMLRVNESQSELVIARIQFKHQRHGYGNRLLSLLNTFARDNNFKTIKLENVMTDAMKTFARKHGFNEAQTERYCWVRTIN